MDMELKQIKLNLQLEVEKEIESLNFKIKVFEKHNYFYAAEEYKIRLKMLQAQLSVLKDLIIKDNVFNADEMGESYP